MKGKYNWAGRAKVRELSVLAVLRGDLPSDSVCGGGVNQSQKTDWTEGERLPVLC